MAEILVIVICLLATMGAMAVGFRASFAATKDARLPGVAAIIGFPVFMVVTILALILFGGVGVGILYALNVLF